MGKRNLIFHLCNANCLGFDYSRLIDCQTRLLSCGNVCKFACQMRQREQARKWGRGRVVWRSKNKENSILKESYIIAKYNEKGLQTFVLFSHQRAFSVLLMAKGEEKKKRFIYHGKKSSYVLRYFQIISWIFSINIDQHLIWVDCPQEVLGIIWGYIIG